MKLIGQCETCKMIKMDGRGGYKLGIVTLKSIPTI